MGGGGLGWARSFGVALATGWREVIRGWIESFFWDEVWRWGVRRDRRRIKVKRVGWKRVGAWLVGWLIFLNWEN